MQPKTFFSHVFSAVMPTTMRATWEMSTGNTRHDTTQNTQIQRGNNRDNSSLNLKRKKKNTGKHGRLVHLLYLCKLK